VKLNKARYGLGNLDFSKVDIDIDITPAGNIDGPSAGGLMTTAIISALTGRAVTPGLAMTGEITKRGDYLPIGGLKQKVMAAHRMGYKEVIFPNANLKDIENIPKEVRDGIVLTPVHTYNDIYPRALAAKATGVPAETAVAKAAAAATAAAVERAAAVASAAPASAPPAPRATAQDGAHGIGAHRRVDHDRPSRPQPLVASPVTSVRLQGPNDIGPRRAWRSRAFTTPVYP
jgi:hypothetical protein